MAGLKLSASDRDALLGTACLAVLVGCFYVGVLIEDAFGINIIGIVIGGVAGVLLLALILALAAKVREVWRYEPRQVIVGSGILFLLAIAVLVFTPVPALAIGLLVALALGATLGLFARRVKTERKEWPSPVTKLDFVLQTPGVERFLDSLPPGEFFVIYVATPGQGRAAINAEAILHEGLFHQPDCSYQVFPIGAALEAGELTVADSAVLAIGGLDGMVASSVGVRVESIPGARIIKRGEK